MPPKIPPTVVPIPGAIIEPIAAPIALPVTAPPIAPRIPPVFSDAELLLNSSVPAITAPAAYGDALSKRPPAALSIAPRVIEVPAPAASSSPPCTNGAAPAGFAVGTLGPALPPINSKAF